MIQKAIHLFQWKNLSKWKNALVRLIFLPGVSRCVGMYGFTSQYVNRPLDSKTYLDFLSIAKWAQNLCKEWNQSVSSLSRAVERKHTVTLQRTRHLRQNAKRQWRDEDTAEKWGKELNRSSSKKQRRVRKTKENKNKKFLPYLPVLRWLYPVLSETC